MIELGGNISLVGFKEFDSGELVVIKKIVGNFVKRVTSKTTEFKSLTLHVKKIKGVEKPKCFEIKAKLETEETYNVSVEDPNLFFAVDKTLKKLESSLGMV